MIALCRIPTPVLDTLLHVYATYATVTNLKVTESRDSGAQKIKKLVANARKMTKIISKHQENFQTRDERLRRLLHEIDKNKLKDKFKQSGVKFNPMRDGKANAHESKYVDPNLAGLIEVPPWHDDS